ncbi:hypothetical protein PhCBS80983_g00685 [Powellomyces hirtus]|uniref:GPI transamidase component PIG-S n=1 Tax=Powellomyces hirtus TaxID=109895 RepID=A0A507EFZ7_9FUNG|nr:hypothetical protein PhCBS80983_g00685 [Powellomyces hirtus]
MSLMFSSPETLTRQFEKNRRRVILSVVAVFLLAAPVWWVTTEVYRAPLPIADIRAWTKPQALRQKLAIDIDLHFSGLPEGQTSTDIAQDVNKQLAVIYQSAEEGHVHVDTTKEQASAGIVGEEIVVPNPDVRLSFNVQAAHNATGPPSENGRYSIHVSCQSSSAIPRIHVDAGRSVVIGLPHCNEDVVQTLVGTIAGLFADEQAAYRSILNPSNPTVNTDWDNMRTMKYARKYQLTLSLLVANPSDMIVGWDIKDAIDAYIHPFLDALNDISIFSVHSQVQNYATLPITPEATNKDGSDIHIIQPHVLPQFINSAQWNLASVVTMAPPINFILYIPSQSQKPLHLVKANGDILSTNAFLMPRWGGIVIANPEANSSTYHYDVQELLPFMEIFISQLRDLLGVKTIRIPNAHLILPGVKITYSQAPMTGITLWEHDRLVRWRTIQNIADAAITLNSLATLIERLESMVVLDIIQTQVLQALGSLQSAHTSLQSSSNHTQSSLHARAAITASESAFFDPTMVAMLYFPDEHKYAVYMPLFVPISVPVLIAVLREIKRWKQGRKKKEHAKKE